MTRRARFGLVAAGVFLFMTILYLASGGRPADPGHASSPPLAPPPLALPTRAPNAAAAQTAPSKPYGGAVADLGVPESVLSGGVIAPKLGNATAKQELGRASWRLMHTMMARFPDKPTADESLALATYMQLFARLYPCGECAAHFQALLDEYPPQTSSRNAAAGWACFVHNEVNKRLGKDRFDCSKIGDFYDCGCGDEDKGAQPAAGGAGAESSGDAGDGDASAGLFDDVAVSVADAKGDGSLKLEKEGLSRGG